MSSKCPYCNNYMKEGSISGDGRSRVRWEDANEKVVNCKVKFHTYNKL